VRRTRCNGDHAPDPVSGFTNASERQTDHIGKNIGSGITNLTGHVVLQHCFAHVEFYTGRRAQTPVN